MGRHALRGAVTAWLALIALQAVTSSGGTGRVSSFFTDVNGLVKRALDPSVPAIPDRSSKASGTHSYMTPGQAAADARTADRAGPGSKAAGAITGGTANNSSLNQYVNGGGLNLNGIDWGAVFPNP